MKISWRDKPAIEKVVGVIPLVVILVVYSAVVYRYIGPRQTIANLDFWYHIDVGCNVRWADPTTLVNGLYPMGYPLLLCWGSRWGWDVLRIGQWLSWLGGALLLSSCYAFILLISRRRALAVVGAIALLANVAFLNYAAIEGNDMLAAGLQAVSVVALWHATSSNNDHRSFSAPWLFLSGLFLALAYLTRYTSLLLLPIFLGYLLLCYRKRVPEMAKAIGGLLLTFLIITSVQWLPSLLVHHTPFYNEQAKNVWFGLYGESDWVNNWNKVEEDIGLLGVVSIDPVRFITHWGGQLQTAFTSLRLLPLPLHLAWIVAIPLLLFYRKEAMARRLFLILIALVPIAVTSLAWLDPRFLLLPLWIQVVLAVLLIDALVRRFPIPQWVGEISVALLILATAFIYQSDRRTDWYAAPPPTHVAEVNHFLRMALMQEPSRVATNDPLLHATDIPARTRYQQAYFANPNPATVEELFAAPAAATWDYLVMDYNVPFGDYSHLREEFRNDKQRLVPLSLSESRDIFCVVPCHADGAISARLAFDNGMVLTGLQGKVTAKEGTLFLYWLADRQMPDSYKVSVRLIDSNDEPRMQSDTVPQLWSYPTPQWPPDQLVVDFYRWTLEAECVDCTLALLVYHEASLAPVLATDERGDSVGPLIPLGRLSDLFAGAEEEEETSILPHDAITHRENREASAD